MSDISDKDETTANIIIGIFGTILFGFSLYLFDKGLKKTSLFIGTIIFIVITGYYAYLFKVKEYEENPDNMYYKGKNNEITFNFTDFLTKGVNEITELMINIDEAKPEKEKEYVNAKAGQLIYITPNINGIIGGLTFGLVFGFIDNAGLWMGMDALDPIFDQIIGIFPQGKDTELIKAGLGNTFSDFLGVSLGTFMSIIMNTILGHSTGAIWIDTVGIVIGCILGILVPVLWGFFKQYTGLKKY